MLRKETAPRVQMSEMKTGRQISMKVGVGGGETGNDTHSLLCWSTSRHGVCAGTPFDPAALHFTHNAFFSGHKHQGRYAQALLSLYDRLSSIWYRPSSSTSLRLLL